MLHLRLAAAKIAARESAKATKQEVVARRGISAKMQHTVVQRHGKILKIICN